MRLKYLIWISVFFIVAQSVISSSSKGFLSDACVQDRTCCENFANSLSFVCFRNDTNSSFSNPFETKDLHYDDSTNYAYLGFGEGKFQWKEDAINNFGGWQGIGRTGIGNSAIQSKIYVFPADRDRIRNNFWGLLGNGDTSSGNNQRSESYTVPINGYSVLTLSMIKCNQGTDCNGTNGVRVDTDYSTGIVSSYACDIDGNYCGLRINWTVTGSGYEWNNMSQWIIAFNSTPDNAVNTSNPSDWTIRWNVSATRNMTLVAVFTLKEYEDNISQWLSNPIKTIDDAINYTQRDMENIKYPTQLNNSQKTQYYSSYWGHRMNTMRALPRDWNVSCWKDNVIFAPTMATYPATWIWDSFFSSWGLLSASIDGNSSGVQNFLRYPKDNLEVWVDNSEKNTKWNLTIVDNCQNVAGTQPDGGWDIAALNLYNRSIINQSYLCNQVYDALKGNYLGHNRSSSVTINSSAFCTSTASGTAGWDGSIRYTGTTCQIDTTGWHLLSAKSLARISDICGNVTEKNNMLNDVTRLNNSLLYMYDYSLNDFCDINSSYQCKYSNSSNDSSYLVSVASAWALITGATTTDKTKNVTAHWQNSTWFNDTNVIATLHKRHPLYDAIGEENWNGVVWPSPNMVAMQGLRVLGEDSTLSWLRNHIITMVDDAQRTDVNGNPIGEAIMGCEAYKTNLSECAPVFAQSSKIPYVWGDSQMFMAVNNPNLMDVLYGNMTAESGGSQPLPEFYNSTSHPRLFTKTKSQILSDVEASDSVILKNYRSYLTSLNTELTTNFTDLCSGLFTNCAYRCARIITPAMSCYLGNATSCPKATEFLEGFLGFNINSTGWNATDADVRACAGHVATTYDLIYNNLTFDQKKRYIHKMQKIVEARFNSSANELSSSRISYHNGQGQNGADVLMVFTIRGEPVNDTNLNYYFNVSNQTVRNYWKGYANATTEREGPSYLWFGIPNMVTATQFYENNYGSLGLSYDAICNLSYSLPFLFKYKNVSSDDTINKNLSIFDYGDTGQNDYPYRSAILWFANRCKQPQLNHIISLMNNYTVPRNYGVDNLENPLDFVFYNNSIGQSMPEDDLYWFDNRGVAIWRSGFKFLKELIFTAISNDEDVSHPQSDDLSITLSYNGINFLVDSGDRNNTDNEIPTGEKRHSSLMVNNKGEFTYSARGNYQPSSNYQLTGSLNHPNVDICTESNYTSCYYAPADFRGEIKKYQETANYNYLQMRKPYYTLNSTPTRDVVYYHGNAVDFIVERIYAFNDTANKNFTLSEWSEYNSTTNQNNLTYRVGTTNLVISNVYNSSQCSWSANTDYYKKVFNTDFITTAYSSILECNNTKNISIVNVMIPYTDSEGNPYTVEGYRNGGNIGAKIISGNTQYLIYFNEINIDTDAVIETSVSTSPSPVGILIGNSKIQIGNGGSILIGG